jgi:hypothetical protein
MGYVQLNADRNVRQAGYVPTFFTSPQNHAALEATRSPTSVTRSQSYDFSIYSYNASVVIV